MPDLVSEIEEIRVRNNHLWMDLVRVALESSPGRAKSILKQINANDRLISDALGRLADE
jgi:hypothetical protein